jgi:release factor glutamine methyltransferase
MTVREALSGAAAQLTGSETAALDAACLLGALTGMNRTALLVNGDTALTAQQELLFADMIARRQTGLPVAYLTGHKEFYGYDFIVTPDVLIPKPDTELLVALATEEIRGKINARRGSLLTICDMCTGSGCIGISVIKTLAETTHVAAADLPSCTCVDISAAALAVARQNAGRLLSEAERQRMHFIQSNLFETTGYTFDVIMTNPPYVPAAETALLLSDGRREPALALNGDITESGMPGTAHDGLGIIRRLVPQARDHLAPHGTLIMETGEYNAEAAAVIMEQAGFLHVHIERDLSGMLRDICGTI